MYCTRTVEYCFCTVAAAGASRRHRIGQWSAAVGLVGSGWLDLAAGGGGGVQRNGTERASLPVGGCLGLALLHCQPFQNCQFGPGRDGCKPRL